MRSDSGQVFKLEEYTPSDYLIPTTNLTFRLDPEQTIVIASLTIERRAGVRAGKSPLVLEGDGLELVSLEIDGKPVAEDGHTVSPDRLSVHALPAAPRFTLTVTTRLAPASNHALMGLYRSNGVYCTQCEAEGFRRITYFLDRPDILSVYTVRIEADRRSAPLLLSNGNPGETGMLPDGRHFAVWHDPYPKPSYLFALVAGDLAVVKDRLVTRSGRSVELGIYVEHGKQDRTAYAMDALKRSMIWDETAFGREYDLDVFNIVAVSDFNMGAMENKGLNIFNDKYVLADEDTATDADFANIEAIIAHEYFHNWTGNRITCRDWFQLCLKEGLTVYRDHEFSADQRSRAVKRIAEVRLLKGHQFPEDQGPLAHPVRPRRYREINNFYTATVYEKGSEVVRMIRTVLGADAFRQGMDLYFERHDGEAATVEDFVKAFEDASGQDLSQFFLWYQQAGTPNVTAKATYSAADKELILEIEQSVPPTPGESRKRIMHIPLAFGLVGPDGEDMGWDHVEGATVRDGVIHLRKRKHRLRFQGIAKRPRLSLNRGFSAPVTLSVEEKRADRLFLARHDGDPYGRWQALNGLLIDTLIRSARHIRGGRDAAMPDDLVALCGDFAADDALEPAYRALALTLPSEADIAREMGSNIDPDAILSARTQLVRAIADAHGASFEALHAAMSDAGPFSPDAESAGRRALKNVLLDYLATGSHDATRAARHYAGATNMTDRAAALAVLVNRHAGAAETTEALASFERSYRNDPLVLDKWFQIQAAAPGPETLEAVRALADHPAFSIANPNRLRALVGTFSSANQTGFHRADGEGYRFFGDIVLAVDRKNPQVAARLATALRSWRSLEPERKAVAREALLRMVSADGLSVDLRDIVERTLA